MKKYFSIILGTILFLSCQRNENKTAENILKGTWQLISGTLIDKGDTTITDYTRGIQMIKIINDTHFAFLNHDLSKGKDSTAAQFVAGGGPYELAGDNYTEHLEYCSYREWEGNTFPFKLTIVGDTLTQEGVEKIEDLGVERLNIEKYKRVTGL